MRSDSVTPSSCVKSPFSPSSCAERSVVAESDSIRYPCGVDASGFAQYDGESACHMAMGARRSMTWFGGLPVGGHTCCSRFRVVWQQRTLEAFLVVVCMGGVGFCPWKPSCTALMWLPWRVNVTLCSVCPAGTRIPSVTSLKFCHLSNQHA